jgi:hypothetical protein
VIDERGRPERPNVGPDFVLESLADVDGILSEAS